MRKTMKMMEANLILQMNSKSFNNNYSRINIIWKTNKLT